MKLTTYGRNTLIVEGVGTAASLYAAIHTGIVPFYWLAAICACMTSFVAGAEFGIAMWKPIAEDAIEGMKEAHALVRKWANR